MGRLGALVRRQPPGHPPQRGSGMKSRSHPSYGWWVGKQKQLRENFPTLTVWRGGYLIAPVYPARLGTIAWHGWLVVSFRVALGGTPRRAAFLLDVGWKMPGGLVG